MANAKRRRTTVKIVKVYNPASQLQLKGAKPMAKAKAAKAANPRRRRRGGSRRRNSSTPRKARRNPSCALQTRSVANPRRRRHHKRRRNPAIRRNPSKQIGNFVVSAVKASLGASAVKFGSGLLPLAQTGWGLVIKEGIVAYLVAMGAAKFDKKGGNEVAIGAFTVPVVDALRMVIPPSWSDRLQAIQTLQLGTGTGAATGNGTTAGLVDYRGMAGLVDVPVGSPAYY